MSDQDTADVLKKSYGGDLGCPIQLLAVKNEVRARAVLKLLPNGPKISKTVDWPSRVALNERQRIGRALAKRTLQPDDPSPARRRRRRFESSGSEDCVLDA